MRNTYKETQLIVLRAIQEGLGSVMDPTITGELELHENKRVLQAGPSVDIRVLIVDDNPLMGHCHVITTLKCLEHHAEESQENNNNNNNNNNDNKLDACCCGGPADTCKEAFQNAARSWIDHVAGPIFSMVHATLVADGVIHFDGTESYAVARHHGFLGKMKVSRATFTKNGDNDDISELLEALQDHFFEHAENMYLPEAGVLHLAKATLRADPDGTWTRVVEIDGRDDVSYWEQPWSGAAAMPPVPFSGVIVIYVVFHNLAEQEHLKQLDKSILQFMKAFRITRDTQAAADRIVAQEGVSEELAWWLSLFVPLGFSRSILRDHALPFSQYYDLVKADGSIERNLPLMKQPVYVRSVNMLYASNSLDHGMRQTLKDLAMTSGDADLLSNAFQSGLTWESIKTTTEFLPSLVPDYNVDTETFEAAAAKEYPSIKKSSHKKRGFRLGGVFRRGRR